MFIASTNYVNKNETSENTQQNVCLLKKFKRPITPGFLTKN